jgi:ribosomal protein S18 acetylase RimI-like enzyme
MEDRDGGLEVGAARRDEIDALAGLLEGHPIFARYALETPAVARSLAGAQDVGESVIVARRSGRAVGFAWWSPRGAFARSPYLRLLVVAAHASGSGAGAALMRAVESAAFADARDLFLLVTRENAHARRFYARRGFVEVGEIHDYVVPGVDEIVMRKRRPDRPDDAVTIPPE